MPADGEIELRPGASPDDPSEVRQYDAASGTWSEWIEEGDFRRRIRGHPRYAELSKGIREKVMSARQQAGDGPMPAPGSPVIPRPTEEPLEDRIKELADHLIAHPGTRLLDLAAASTTEGMRRYTLAKQLLDRRRLFEHPRTKVLSFYDRLPSKAAAKLVPVRVLEKIEVAVEGEDIKAGAEEVINLPENIARALVKRGAAVEIGDTTLKPKDVPTAAPEALAGEDGPPMRPTPAGTSQRAPLNIPEQLRMPDLRFVLVKERGKNPIEKGWQDGANYPHDHDRLQGHLARGGNYGVLCGRGLVVIDADDPEVREIVQAALPRTLTVKTGRASGEGRHFYFVCEDLPEPIRLARSGDAKGTIGDVQSTGKQVIGPGSIHPSGNRYEVLEDRPLATVTAERIRFALRGFLPPMETDTPEDMKREMKHGGDDLDQLRLENIIPLDGLTRHGSEYQGPCPWHGSDTGSNFTIDTEKNVWHCFRHGSGGGPMAAIAVMENVIGCEEGRKGALRGDRFLETLALAEEKHGLLRSARAAANPGDNAKNDPTSRSIIKLVEENGLEVFTDQFKEPYAAIERDGHREIMAIASPEFELWVRYLHYKRSGGEGLGDDTLKRAVSTLKARAVFEGPRYELSLRVAWHESELWYDLGRDDWSAVRISPDVGPQGWEVVARPPIVFKRVPQMAAQDVPEPGGDWSELWECINLPLDDYGVLCRSHLAHLFVDGHPRPFLDIYNRRGAAKSITSGFIRALVDPSTTPTAPLKDVDRNFNNIMDQNYLPVFDNLKTITESLEDKFCRTVTGEASQERRLGTNRVQEVYQYRRTGILNSVHPLGLNAPEVAARIIYLEAPFIPEEERLTEAELNAKFYCARPKILGYIFSILARAISLRPGLELENLPRFADYMLWGEAISRALGEEEGAFAKEYRDNINQTISATIDENPLAQAILQYFVLKETDHYIGTAEPLYVELQLIACDKNIDTKSKEAANNWPGAANALSRKMPDIIDDLKRFGLYYAKVSYKDLSEAVKNAMPEKNLASGRSIIMIVRRDSKWFGELPMERRRDEKKRFPTNIVSPSQQGSEDTKKEEMTFSLGRSKEGRSDGA